MGLPLAIGNHGSGWADQLGWSGPSPGIWSRGRGTCGSPFTPVFVVFVFVVFVCVYWRQCLYHPVGTPSGWLPGERRSYLRLGRHLSKKKKFGQMDPFPSLSLSLSASLSLCLSLALSLFFLSLSLKHTHSLSLGVVCPLYIM